MRSSFFEFSVAQTGLFTAKAGMNVVSHNVANKNTPGYSRQVLLQSANTPMGLNNGRGMLGTGVSANGINQIRNSFLDKTFWNQNAVLGGHGVKNSQYSVMQGILNETDDTGFSKQVNAFFKSLDTASKPAGDSAVRNNAIQSGLSLTKQFNEAYAALQKQQRDVDSEVRLTVSQMNSIGRQIQSLNKQIYVSETDGSSANDLRDQRALLVDQLSKLVNVEVSEVDFSNASHKNDKRFIVSINGYDFVNHFDVNELECRERTTLVNPEDVDKLSDIYFKSSNVKLNSSNSMATLNGELKGLLDIRDGNNLNTFAGKIDSVSNATNPHGGGMDYLKITITNFNRGDMQSPGVINIGDKSYPYDKFEVDDSTPPKAVIYLPPNKGTASINGKNFEYEITANSGGDIGVKFKPPLTAAESNKDIILSGINIGSTATVGENVTITNALKPASISASAGDDVSIGNKVNARGIPYFISKLNTFVRTFARAFNEGKDINGNLLEGLTGGHKDAYGKDNETGWNFFSYYENIVDGTKLPGQSAIDYNKINAGNFTISEEILENQDLFATGLSPDNTGVDDNRWLESILSIKHNPDVFGNGEIGNYLESILGDLSVEASHAEMFEKNYTNVVVATDNQRISVMGVEENEEYSKLIAYQQAYNTAAKLIGVIDEIYDTAIKLGIG